MKSDGLRAADRRPPHSAESSTRLHVRACVKHPVLPVVDGFGQSGGLALVLDRIVLQRVLSRLVLLQGSNPQDMEKPSRRRRSNASDMTTGPEVRVAAVVDADENPAGGARSDEEGRLTRKRRAITEGAPTVFPPT